MKKYIYLDQNCLSDLSKEYQAEKKGQCLSLELKELNRLIIQGVKSNKLVIPISIYHVAEKKLWQGKGREALQEYIKDIGLESNLILPDEIYIYHLKRAAREFVGETTESLNKTIAYNNNEYDYEKAIKESASWINENFYRNVCFSMAQKPIRSFTKRELTNAGKQRGYSGTVKKQMQSEMREHKKIFLNQYVRFVFPEIIKSEDRVLEFRDSKFFSEIPMLKLSCYLWAKNCLNEGFQEGDETDIDAISSYLPFVDAMTMDKSKKSFLQEDEFYKDYNTNIFSIKKDDLKNLIRYLKRFESK